MSLELLLARYGLFALFVGAGFEGETIVTLGGILVQRGTLPYTGAVLAAACGSFIADQIFFRIGRRSRDSKFVRKLHARAAFARALRTFDRYPTGFVFSFRFLWGLRTVSPVAIGTTSLPAPRFAAINAVSALLWATLFVTLGFWFGEAITELFGRIAEVGRVLLMGAIPALLIAAAGYFAVLSWRARKR
ncbi:DedA family protein [Stakelama marina]|uniref:DedA family protein n=1 Tax=Stakelama marina TaxID=2826939 RepID=A0A8T4IMM1_9SPHN|nr:DedA family protein [Stakelama marina]MBR0553569.1 DedA family protein [Stakelama marina]